MAKGVFAILGTIFLLQGVAVLYAFSSWGPAKDATLEEVLSNITLLGLPASFLCFSVVYSWPRRGRETSHLPYWQLGGCLLIWLLSLWLTMVSPWHLVTRLGAALLAATFGVANLLRRRAM
jgi:hypothetical protein